MSRKQPASKEVKANTYSQQIADLQSMLLKYEREAQIEAALERVRSLTMAMHNSNELGNVAILLYKEFRDLGITKFFNCGFITVHEKEGMQYGWMTQPEGTFMEQMNLPCPGDQILKKRLKAWKEKVPVFLQKVGGKPLERHLAYVAKHSISDNQVNAFLPFMPDPTFFYCGNFVHGYLQIITGEELSKEAEDILARFSKIFNQTYTRFLDLQKAEAQTREALIETALERVRAKAMSMHSSQDLSFTVDAFFSELELLEVKPRRCGVGIIDRDTRIVQVSASAIRDDDKTEIVTANLTLTGHPVLNEIFERFLDQKEYQPILRGKEIQNYYQVMNPEVAYPDIEENETEYGYYFFFKEGGVFAWTNEELSKRDIEIFRRFNSVLSLTYRRYIDLLDAEAQAREAQIEAAMERIRSRAIAMRSSDELKEVIIEMRRQIDSLGQLDLEASVIHLYNDGAKMFESFAAVRPPGESGEIVVANIFFPVDAMKQVEYMIDMYHSDQQEYIIEFDKEMAEKWQEVMVEHAPMIAARRVGFVSNRRTSDNPEYWNFADFSLGSLLLVTHSPASDDTKEVLRKGAQVFDQAYTRFLDLQRAEAQAREAQIEAALERVRSQTMAMHKTEDLREVVGVLNEQVNLLHLADEGCNINVFRKDINSIETWMAGFDGISLPDCYYMEGKGHPFLKRMWDTWERQVEPFHITSSGEELGNYVTYLLEETDLKRIPDDIKKMMLSIPKVHFSFVTFKYGQIEIVNSTVPPSQENLLILTRFAKVFEQSYTRFLDLQKAEAQARDAYIEASLERVRGRAMAMHKSNELSEAAELLYSEFKKLGITPYSCGYVINDEEINRWQVWMTDANDDAFKTVWSLPYDADKHLKDRYDSWKRKEAFHASVLEGEENAKHHRRITEFAPHKEGALGTLPDKLVLSSAHFEQGHLLIVTPDKLESEMEHILTRFAKVFEQTYTRFLDLQTAEEQAKLIKEERDRLNIALDNLKSTQSQLVQAEKMASLGELTAGIAHEIQNPLNFVNNFSDVSGEMIDEAVEEFTSTPLSDRSDRSDTNEQNEEELVTLRAAIVENVKDILNDLKGNLEKISHHGNRASSIVKGMLDHSRANTGEKVPTDINALCDEYLRLSYHGLRAKDKSFNAAYEMHFDNDLPKIKVIPQEFGRVLLNIINNAFYAVNKKAKGPRSDSPLGAWGEQGKVDASSPNAPYPKGSHAPDATYSPLVTITTQRLHNSAIITIKDNGIGMSQETIDKVFQPFFTTKPTGQGTGLGMSISYDIITQGHGGDIALTSELNEGSEFTIHLPILT